MGATYGNISVKGLARQTLIDWLAANGISALVGPEAAGWVAFSDAQTDVMEAGARDAILRALTAAFPCVAAAVFMYDEEDPQCIAARDGRLAGRFWLCPGMIMDDPAEDDMRSRLEDPAAFLAAFGLTDEAELRRTLKVGEPDALDPFDAHEVLVARTGMPRYAIGFGYRYARAGEWDPSQGDLVET